MNAKKQSLLTLFLLLFVHLNSISSKKITQQYSNNEKKISSLEKFTQNIFANLGDSSIRPSYGVLKKGIKGMHNLLNNKKICKNQYLTLIDYTKSCNKKRLWVIDLKSRSILFYEYVAHGIRTGKEFAYNFSNISNSRKSSLGFFETGPIYNGKHKTSLKLLGLERNFNSNALQRGIVIHGAKYVSERYIESNGHLGRSFGCPSVSTQINHYLVNVINKGSCLFIYADNSYYLNNSSILNKPINFDATLFE